MSTFDYKSLLQYKPKVHGFFDSNTNTISYVVVDEKTNRCAIVDSVMDYEPHGATLSFENADAIIEFVQKHAYTVEWVLETHVHADHLSAAPYIKEKLGGTMAIGEHIIEVQDLFGKVFNDGTEFKRDGSQFDRLWKDEDAFTLGSIPARVIYTPGHTPADITYIIGDAVFSGDTLFMPDYGTARVDFPGGDALAMYHSAQKIFTLPEEMRMFMCHDYLPPGRTEYQWETTVGEQKRENIQLNAGTDPDRFATMRKERDATLGMPRLIIPSIQVNIRGGEIPEHEGRQEIVIPVNSIFSKNRSSKE